MEICFEFFCCRDILREINLFLLVSGEVKASNARFSTASSIEGDDQLQLDQLVVAQVHHDPIHEKRVEEEQELKGIF